jgi:hypothetical protein
MAFDTEASTFGGGGHFSVVVVVVFGADIGLAADELDEATLDATEELDEGIEDEDEPKFSTTVSQ